MQLSVLKKKTSLIVSASMAAFMLYFCMYAFRKPFAVGMFEGIELWGINYKVVLIVAQVIGYTISKFIGIKVISELKHDRRPVLILVFIGLAELALLGFAIVEPPYNFIFLFLNGLPLGMIWGLVFSYLEGRTVTEILATILSSSFILASGVTKSVGKFLMLQFSISEFWMPFVTGAVFIIPLLVAVWWIERIPEPDAEDKRNRKERVPMDREDRKTLFWGLFPGLMAIIIMYFFITAFRDYRDNFSAEIWEATGFGNKADVFATTELMVTIGALMVLAFFVFIRNNARAVRTMILVMLAGIGLIGLATFLYQNTLMENPLVWMVLIGLGGYVAYIPLGSMLFERIVASLEFKSNAGFLIYIADAVGYLGSVIVLFYKEFFFEDLSILDFFIKFSYFTFFIASAGLLYAFFYFNYLFKGRQEPDVGYTLDSSTS